MPDPVASYSNDR